MIFFRGKFCNLIQNNEVNQKVFHVALRKERIDDVEDISQTEIVRKCNTLDKAVHVFPNNGLCPNEFYDLDNQDNLI